MMRRTSSIAVFSGAVLTGLLLPSSASAQAGPSQETFAYIPGGGTEDWIVPDQVCEISYVARGAGGGRGYSVVVAPTFVNGGHGALNTGTLAVAPGMVVTVEVGGAGETGTSGILNAGDTFRSYGGTGQGDGGDSGPGTVESSGGGGGGGSSVSLSGSVVAVAGGGGGGSVVNPTTQAQGGSGGLDGIDGFSHSGSANGGGEGGSQVAPGAGGSDPLPSAGGIGPDGGDGTYRLGGGGGGGYFGGGSGAAGGGGGGSSLVPTQPQGTGTVVDAGGTATEQDGSVELSWTVDPECTTQAPLASPWVLGAVAVALVANGGRVAVSRRRTPPG